MSRDCIICGNGIVPGTSAYVEHCDACLRERERVLNTDLLEATKDYLAKQDAWKALALAAIPIDPTARAMSFLAIRDAEEARYEAFCRVEKLRAGMTAPALQTLAAE